jgi:hypothetical protein
MENCGNLPQWRLCREFSLLWNLVWSCCLAGILLWSGIAEAGPLSDRLSQFPDWPPKPTVEIAQGDLVYPQWFLGTWEMSSTLMELVAPLAPTITTPGFEGNRQYLNQPVSALVRFVPPQPNVSPQPSIRPTSIKTAESDQVVSDRAFNGLNLARAYLGDRAVLSVKVNSNNPNQQITRLVGDRTLLSLITGRQIERSAPYEFITTEIFQQIFQGAPQLYFNTVETTTAYHYRLIFNPVIEAEQVTALYLSPQDPDYFKAKDRPIALYRYHLELKPAKTAIAP